MVLKILEFKSVLINVFSLSTQEIQQLGCFRLHQEDLSTLQWWLLFQNFYRRQDQGTCQAMHFNLLSRTRQKFESHALTAVTGPATLFLTICPSKSWSDCQHQSGQLENLNVLRQLHAWNWGPSFSKATSIQIQIFLKLHFFYKNCSSIHMQPVNPLTETTSFLNRSSELAFKAPVHTNLGGKIWDFQNVWILVNTVRVHTVLKSPWILGEVLEESLNSIFPWKALKFLCKSLKSPWIFFNFKFSSLESVFWCFLVVQDRI